MTSPTPPTPAQLEGATVHRDLAYVPHGHPRQKLDLYLPPAGKDLSPAGENLPLIIWVHGGAFRLGDKRDKVPLGYLERGYAVASINYRLSQHDLFPAQIEDCKAAVRWLRAHAAQFGLDPQRFAAWGESAGGHLAAMLGTAGHVRAFEVGGPPETSGGPPETSGGYLEVSSRVQAVVDYFGPTDFGQMDAHRVPGGQVHDAPDSPESELVGGPIQDKRDKVAQANPITYLRPDAPPFLIVHGEVDPLVPHHQSELLHAALQRAGVPVSFYTVQGAGHGGFTDPEVPRLTQAFLARHLESA
jgi:acetyl esterase/lipase